MTTDPLMASIRNLLADPSLSPPTSAKANAAPPSTSGAGSSTAAADKGAEAAQHFIDGANEAWEPFHAYIIAAAERFADLVATGEGLIDALDRRDDEIENLYDENEDYRIALEELASDFERVCAERAPLADYAAYKNMALGAAYGRTPSADETLKARFNAMAVDYSRALSRIRELERLMRDFGTTFSAAMRGDFDFGGLR